MRLQQFEDGVDQVGVVVGVGIQPGLAVAAARQQSPVAPVMGDQVVSARRAESILRGRCSRRPARAMPLIISAFQLASILSSRPGRTRLARLPATWYVR